MRWTLAATAASLAVCLAVLGWYYIAFIPSLPEKAVQEYLAALRQGRMNQAAAFWVETPEAQFLAERSSRSLVLYGIHPRFQSEEVSYFVPGQEKPLPRHAPAASLRAVRVRLSGLIVLSDVPYRASFLVEDINRNRPLWWLYKEWRISRIEGLEWLKQVPAAR